MIARPIKTARSLQILHEIGQILSYLRTAPEKKRVKNRVGYHGEFWL